MLLDQIPSDVIEYIDNHWKPNQDDNYVMVEKDSLIYNTLKPIFEQYLKLNDSDKEKLYLDIGPFIKVRPYGMFPSEDSDNRIEFLFEYETIDRSKLRAKHLTLN